MKRTVIVFSGLIITLVIIFFAYDLMKIKLSPCDAIFEQTSTKLDGKLTLVKAKGEVSIGNEQIQELTEASQLTALNLKACCITSSNAGKVDSGQFLECKNSVAKYEVQLDTVISQLEELKIAKQQGNTELAEKKLKKINETVEEAKSISQELENKLKIIPVQKNIALKIYTQEVEPNGDLFNATSILLDTKIKGQVADSSDNDYFRFTTPPKYRDIILISLENRSTTLQPALRILNNEKSNISDWKAKGTPGADLKYSFTSVPDSMYYIQVASHNHNTSGAYSLAVAPALAYDEYEPNDNSFQAKTISPGEAVDVAIMDGSDDDFYKFKTPSYTSNITVSIKNRSTTLQPALRILNNEKSNISDWKAKGTPGADLKYSFTSVPDSMYYIQVASHNHNTSGAYILTLSIKEAK